jgi:hypothetical protein
MTENIDFTEQLDKETGKNNNIHIRVQQSKYNINNNL